MSVSAPRGQGVENNQLPNQKQKLCQLGAVLDVIGLLRLRCDYLSCNMVLKALRFPGPSSNLCKANRLAWEPARAQISWVYTFTDPNGKRNSRLFSSVWP